MKREITAASIALGVLVSALVYLYYIPPTQNSDHRTYGQTCEQDLVLGLFYACKGSYYIVREEYSSKQTILTSITGAIYDSGYNTTEIYWKTDLPLNAPYFKIHTATIRGDFSNHIHIGQEIRIKFNATYSQDVARRNSDNITLAIANVSLTNGVPMRIEFNQLTFSCQMFNILCYVVKK